ncbi:MAG: serine/threonine-protein phosphatase, partial [Nitrospinae bacterium]|nr:serine/threonine-protein phosphatase [Nitrospinota bacterium]
CTEIGGDYFDFIPLNGRGYGIVIGDVSGHGVGAALLMASARSILRGLLVESGLTASQIITDLNTIFVKDVTPGNYMTIVYGLFEPSTGKYSYTNAGHVLPFIYNPVRKDIKYLESHGSMVGVFDDSEFHEGQVMLEKGEILVLFTDGITEHTIETEQEIELFSKERFEKVIYDSADQPLKTIAENIMEAMQQFSPKEYNDDITLVMIRRNQT